MSKGSDVSCLTTLALAPISRNIHFLQVGTTQQEVQEQGPGGPRALAGWDLGWPGCGGRGVWRRSLLGED